MNRAISLACKNSKELYIYKDLREKLEYWRFLDDWECFSFRRPETHFQIILATDSSLYKWGAFF